MAEADLSTWVQSAALEKRCSPQSIRFGQVGDSLEAVTRCFFDLLLYSRWQRSHVPLRNAEGQKPAWLCRLHRCRARARQRHLVVTS